MSQQKQPPGEPPGALKCSRTPGPHSRCLASCSALCAEPSSTGCSSCPQKAPAPGVAHPKRGHRQPRCVSGGTTYLCKEEEC